MKICNYQDELLADLAVQPAQILDKIEACNKRTRVNVLWKLDHRFTLVLVQPVSCFGKSPFSKMFLFLQNKGLFVTFQISLDFSASQNGKRKNTHCTSSYYTK